jgi:hypothetical protein
MLLGSVFDANSLGKWIYDWTVYHHGPATPIADMAGELWLLIIQLAGKTKRAEECMPTIRMKENQEMVEDFIESGERLTDKLKKLLKACEIPMIKEAKKAPNKQPGNKVGTEFVDSIFGRDRHLEATEKFMASVRLWNLRFDANCEDILRRPRQYNGTHTFSNRNFSNSDSSHRRFSNIIVTSVAIRTAFGLEDIPEVEPTTCHSKDSIVEESTKLGTEKCKSVESVDQSNVTELVTPSTSLASANQAAPSASVTCSDDDWSSFLISKKDKKKKSKKTAEGMLNTECKIPGRHTWQDDGCDLGISQKIEQEQEATMGGLAKEDSNAKIDDNWNVWGFGMKKARRKEKVILPDVGESKEDSATKLEWKEGLDLGWGFTWKKDKEKKEKSAEETSEKEDASTNPQQKEDLDVFGWGFSSLKKAKKKKTKTNRNVWDDESTILPENGLVPSLVSDSVSKNEDDADSDPWSGWGKIKKRKKKENESEVGPAEDAERDIHTGIIEP